MFIESHAHISHFKFDNSFRFLSYDFSSDTFSVVQGDRASLLEDMKHQRIGAIIEPAIDIESNQRVLEIAVAYPDWIFPAVGLHPTRTSAAKWRDRNTLRELSRRPGIVAIGEAGLDFHFTREQQHRVCQVRWFIFQILLAHRRRLPLILHIRQADRMALPILRLFRPLLHGGVAHCFYGDVTTAEAFIKLGFCLGIGGTLLQNGEAGEMLAETVRQIPLERIILETDAPYVHPSCDAVPNAKTRGKVRNTSLIIPAIAERIAELKGTDVVAVERQTTENAIRVFRLSMVESQR